MMGEGEYRICPEIRFFRSWSYRRPLVSYHLVNQENHRNLDQHDKIGLLPKETDFLGKAPSGAKARTLQNG